MAGPAIPIDMDNGIVLSVSGNMELYRTPPTPYVPRRGGDTFDLEIAQQVLYALANGESLIQVCKNLNVDFSTVTSWALDDVAGFGKKYARARLSGCYYINEYCLEIADNCSNDWMESNDPDNPGWRFNSEHAARTRLRLEQRRFFLSKIAPKIFGDKLDLTVRPDNEQTAIREEIRKATPEQLEVLQQAALICEAAGVRIRLEGFEPSRSVVIAR